MAEALARDLMGDRGECFSAGSQPSGKVHPRALEVLKEKGLATGVLTSKSVHDFSAEFLSSLDYVITLCAEEVCPLVVSPAQRIHWPLLDPAAASDEEMLESFRTIRDQIEARLQAFLSTKI
ncbi:MAG: arsenate reductase ArsC [Bdellovibrionales bacterium]|nr:arsenate reductase ArsC [Bdellovibrionales bacterium]